MIRSLSRSALFAAVAALSIALPASAQDVTVLPGDGIPAVAVSPPFGAVAAGGVATTQYSHLGLILSDRGAAGPSFRTAIFNDPPLAFAGVNDSNVVDLVTAVDGRFVVPGTATPGLTNLIQVVAGSAGAGGLTLRAYDAAGSEIGFATNPADGFSTFSVLAPGFTIASFRVETTTDDAFGVNQIQFNTPVAGAAVVPEATSLALALPALGMVGAVVLKRRRK